MSSAKRFFVFAHSTGSSTVPFAYCWLNIDLMSTVSPSADIINKIITFLWINIWLWFRHVLHFMPGGLEWNRTTNAECNYIDFMGVYGQDQKMGLRQTEVTSVIHEFTVHLTQPTNIWTIESIDFNVNCFWNKILSWKCQFFSTIFFLFCFVKFSAQCFGGHFAEVDQIHCSFVCRIGTEVVCMPEAFSKRIPEIWRFSLWINNFGVTLILSPNLHAIIGNKQWFWSRICARPIETTVAA